MEAGHPGRGRAGAKAGRRARQGAVMREGQGAQAVRSISCASEHGGRRAGRK